MILYLLIGMIWAIISMYGIYNEYKDYKKTEFVFELLLGGFICVFIWPISMIANVLYYIKNRK